MATSTNKRNALRTKKALRQWSEKATDTFERALGEGAIFASRALQKKINKNVDRPTRWTQQAVGNTNYKNRSGTRHQGQEDRQSGRLSETLFRWWQNQ